MSKLKTVIPKYTVIEKTAGELAACFYEAGRSSGLTSKHKNARAYAKANIERFIPKAVEILTTMLGQNNIADLAKQEIYEALMERANAPGLEILNEPVPQFKLPESWTPVINSKGSKRIQ